MLDKVITDVQEVMIGVANAFVHRNTGMFSGRSGTIALGGLENRVVMTLTILSTSAIDYLKFPLAAIEEAGLGIFSILSIPFKQKPTLNRTTHHLKQSAHYVTLIFSKIILGTLCDLDTCRTGLLAPHKIPCFVPASYYGSLAVYNKNLQDPAKRNNPSLYLTD